MNRDKPNFVVIMADQMAPDVVGALGHPAVRTPHIDRLAAQGAAFTNCYSNSPLCAPSRASFVTGKLVRHIGVYDNGSELPASSPTILHHLRRSGYETVLSGKMHFVGPDQLHGFEHRLTTDIYPSSFNWTPDWSRGAYPNPGTSAKRVKHSGVCKWNVQMEYDEEVLYHTLHQIRHYGQKQQEKPFFLCASFTHPHDPFLITEKYWKMYEGVDIPLPSSPAKPMDGMHPYNQWIQIHHEADQHHFTDEEIVRARRAYYGMVTYFDDMVGQIVGGLERFDLARNTIIVVTSDHGEMLGEHGMWFKRTFFDSSAKVPLVISWPGAIQPGSRVNQVVSLLDLSATLMKLASVPGGEDWMSQMDGDSFHGLLESGDPEWKNEAICEYYAEGAVQPMVAYRQGRYKYVYVHEHAPLLFDLQSDPLELHDLSDVSEYRETAAQMKSRVTDGVDFDALAQSIRRSQKERLMMAQALKIGQRRSWDYEPRFDASKQYVR